MDILLLVIHNFSQMLLGSFGFILDTGRRCKLFVCFSGLARFGSQCVVKITKRYQDRENLTPQASISRIGNWGLGGTWRMGPHVVSGWLLGLQTSYN